MQTYNVTVRDEVDAVWIFRCQADDMRHAAEQALDEVTVREVMQVEVAAVIVFRDNMQRSLDMLNAAEEILQVTERAWAGIVGVVKLRVGPLAHISSVTEFIE